MKIGVFILMRGIGKAVVIPVKERHPGPAKERHPGLDPGRESSGLKRKRMTPVGHYPGLEVWGSWKSKSSGFPLPGRVEDMFRGNDGALPVKCDCPGIASGFAIGY